MSLLNELNALFDAPDKEANPHKMSGVLPEPNREMSELSRTKYAYIFDGLDDMELPTATIDAIMANKAIDQRIRTGAQEIEDIAKVNALRADAIRESRGGKDRVRTSAEAKAKLQELKYRQSFYVPDALARNMQALVSYYNGKPDGKRFKTKRVSNDQTLEITRMR